MCAPMAHLCRSCWWLPPCPRCHPMSWRRLIRSTREAPILHPDSQDTALHVDLQSPPPKTLGFAFWSAVSCRHATWHDRPLGSGQHHLMLSVRLGEVDEQCELIAGAAGKGFHTLFLKHPAPETVAGVVEVGSS